MRFALPDEAATCRLARLLAAELPGAIAGWLVVLQGELGAGKSTFARALLNALGHKGAVPSPTYTLVEPYETLKGIIYHIDLYRITSESELPFLGWSDLEDGMRLIEWPERIEGLESRADIKIRFAYQGSGRTADILAPTERGQSVLSGLPKFSTDTGL